MKKIFLSIICILLTVLLGACTTKIPDSQGVQGEQGAPGQDGKDGFTPTIEISPDGYWVINGIKTDKKAIGTDGTNGTTPLISVSDDGYLIINDIKTEFQITKKECIHNFIDSFILESTCISRKTLKSCTLCSLLILVDEEPIAEHSYSTSKNRVCSVCGVKPESEWLEYKCSQDGTYYEVIGIGDCPDNYIIIPNEHNGLPVKKIGNSAFNGESEIFSIQLSSNISHIGDFAFYNSGITNIYIPSSIELIGNCALSNCFQLRKITVDENNEYYCSIDDNLYNKDQTVFIQYAIGKLEDSFILPETTTSIGNYAFASSCLQNININDAVISIGDSAFENCYSLSNVIFSENSKLTLIAYRAFYNCYNLTNIKIPDGVTYIGYEAFANCYRLNKIIISKSVRSINHYAFSGCDSLTSVYYTGTFDEWNKISISSNNSKLTEATRYYHSETEPTEEGNFWHYVDGEIVVW